MNSAWFCEQAAAKALLSALPGAAGAAVLVAAPEVASGLATDSWATLLVAVNKNAQSRMHIQCFVLPAISFDGSSLNLSKRSELRQDSA